MDPMNFFSNSSNFENQQDDYFPDLDHITQDLDTGSNPQTEYDSPQNFNPTNTNTNTSSGAKGWNAQEDLALMYAWCNASKKASVGTNQTSTTFWNRISEVYEEARKDNSRLMVMGSERSVESLRNRYKRLNTNVTKWVGAYKEAYSRKASGMSDADIEKEAQIIYAKTKFTHHEVFEQIMRHNPKWELNLGNDRGRTRSVHILEGGVEEDHGGSKKSRTTEEDDDPNNSTLETLVSEASTIRRPAGRDKAKGRRKGKAKVSQQSVIPEEYTAELQAMRITREKEVDAIHKMGDMRMQSAIMMSKMNMLNTLLGKSHLSPQEESLKDRLMAELFP